ncbi:MAG: carbon monoxide dehydrogenase, partial [Nitrosopumilaceae archaeon]|nr:carbon monoxide dehydrogenase [Nitrosopumilaceae archaeon]
ALEKACSHFNYVSARKDQNKRREKGELVGIGVAMYVEPCGQGWEAARVTMHADGNVTVASGSPSQGQGHETTFAKIAAGILQCEESKIKVVTFKEIESGISVTGRK